MSSTEIECMTREEMDCPTCSEPMTGDEVFTVEIIGEGLARIRCAACSPRLLEELSY